MRGERRSAASPSRQPDRTELRSCSNIQRPRRRMARVTALHFDPPPDAAGRQHRHLSLRAGAASKRRLCSLRSSCNKPRPAEARSVLPWPACAHRREMRRSQQAGAATVETSNELFNEVLCQATADLSMLMTETPQGRYPYAGIPWYSTTFGRDGLITAMQMLWFDPRHGARRAASGSRTFRRRPSIRSPTPSPARSCMKCAAAKWRRSAKCRSRTITAASTPRRCSCCSPASMWSAPATTRRSRRAVARDRGRARMDRRPRRSRQGRLCRISAR